MTYLSEHLTLEEVTRASSYPIPESFEEKIPRLAAQFESVRAAGGGVPITLSSYYRSQFVNTLVGGAHESDHLIAEAWDGTPDKSATDITSWARSVVASIAARQTPDIGQMIIYPYSDGHAHISFPGARGKVNEFLVEVAASGSNRYALWDGVGPLPPWIGKGVPGASSDAGLPTDEGAAGGLKWVTLALLLFTLWVLSEVLGD